MSADATAQAIPLIASQPIAALPEWLARFVPAKPDAASPWSARLGALVAQSASAFSCGLPAAEVQHIAQIIRMRLQLDLAGIAPGSRADGTLDDWLVARIVQSARWSPHQRRAWWQVERLALMVDILERWTRRHLLDQVDGAAGANERLREISTHWLDVAEACWNWGEEVYALFAHRMSENLLDCTWAAGHRTLMSLRRGSRRGVGASRSGAAGTPAAADDAAAPKPSDGGANGR